MSESFSGVAGFHYDNLTVKNLRVENLTGASLPGGTTTGGGGIVSDGVAIVDTLVKLQAAVIAANLAPASIGIIGVSANITVADDFNIPKNLNVVFLSGGRLTVAESKTLTINSYVDALPNQQIFDCLGAVSPVMRSVPTTRVRMTNASNTDFYLEWFGAKADNQTDCFKAFKLCLNAMNVTNNAGGLGTLHLGKGVYFSSAIIWIFGTVIVRGQGFYQSGIRFPPSVGGIYVDSYLNSSPGALYPNGEGSIFEDFRLIGANTPIPAGQTPESANLFNANATGLYSRSTIYCRRVMVSNFDGHGIAIEGNTTNGVADAGYFEGCVEAFNYGDGIRFVGGDSQVNQIIGNQALNNRGVGHRDVTATGNLFLSCHGRNNFKGDYNSYDGATRDFPSQNQPVFISCYGEGSNDAAAVGDRLGNGTLVLGGNLCGHNYSRGHQIDSSLAGLRQYGGRLELQLPAYGKPFHTLGFFHNLGYFGEYVAIDNIPAGGLHLNGNVEIAGELTMAAAIKAIPNTSLSLNGNVNVNGALLVNGRLIAGYPAGSTNASGEPLPGAVSSLSAANVVAALPVASEDLVGQLFLVQASGGFPSLYFCAESSSFSGGFEFYSFSLGS